MYKADFKILDLNFINPAGTSRGILKSKPSWIIRIIDKNNNTYGFGECSILPGLSIDNSEFIEEEIAEKCFDIEKNGIDQLHFSSEFPAIEFGFETALKDLQTNGDGILFPSEFTKGQKNININGLIWMGNQEFMLQQVKEKVNDGFTCIKIKIGAIDFDKELEILRFIRAEFPHKNLEIRVDANGAFSPEEALEKIEALSVSKIHSIEQPIKAGQYGEMETICRKSKIPVALDEELIGINNYDDKEKILSLIRPQYIILKPGLLGGFSKSEEWIQLANKYKAGWWITSALESSIGLNAIAQWTYTFSNNMPQGLGTGLLFSNNLDSHLYIKNGKLRYNPESHTNWNNHFKSE